MANRSDFRDPRTNLLKLLPEVFQSQTNDSIFEDVFNRFVSKPQLELVNGFAGQAFNNTAQSRLIQEPTPHRQAFQLQPILFSKVGAVNHLASYVDILNELERLGISACRLPLWGNALQFNWVPPIDIDKLVNFRDYWWFDENDPTSDPQYITIENPCIQAKQRVAAYQATIDAFGDLQPIVGLSSSNQTIAISGDLSKVFTDGFIFFVTNSTNPSIHATFFTTVSSSYNATTNRTTIIVEEDIDDDSIVDGDITLEQVLTVLKSQQQCACGADDIGWDIGLWDDNQTGPVLWATGLLESISHPTEAAWLANNTGSPQIPTDLAIWYDTSTDQLKQFLSSGSPQWNVVQSNFSVIVSMVTGTHFWDYTSTCAVETNPWTDQNKWFHKNHVTDFSIAKQAKLPIIEYDFSTQLNRWTFTDYGWKYRESVAFNFAVTTDKPSLNELIPFKYVINAAGVGSPVINTITLSPEHGDQTDVFVAGYQFEIENDSLDAANNKTYTVASSVYTTTDTTPGEELATTITITGTFSSANQSNSSTSGSPLIVGSGGRLIPRFTSVGHSFQGYNVHWLLNDSTVGTEPATGKLLPVPSPPPEVNPQVEIDFLSVPVQVPGRGEYITSTPVDLSASYGTEPYVLSMLYTVLPTIAPGGVPAGTVIPLDPRMISRAPMGETVVRVVHNDQQIYGTFTELDSGIGGSPAFGGSPILSGSPSTGANDGFVDSITLSFDLEEFDTLLITVGEQAIADIGRHAVPVRTIADDAKFTQTGSPVGSQPETLSLVQYRRADQLKTETNEYPLFDIFDCAGEPLYDANSLFVWQEDPNLSINANIGKRIVGTTTQDFAFENLLIDPDTLPRPVLYTYKSGLTNRTVWRKGLNDEHYVPSYVNRTGVIGSPAIAVNDPEGSWEIPDQLYFNAEHENRQYITFPELITHFRTIIEPQNSYPGVILAGSQAYLHSDLNYGLGGRIKEFNDSYDTFLSSAFVNNVTPIGLIDFAHDQYENSLNTIKELYRSNLLDYLKDTSFSSILDFQSTVNDAVISLYEFNDFLSIVYGDSNTFIEGSPRLGVRNWPATLPFVGLGIKHKPYVIDDSELGLLQLVHHDGHRSQPSLTISTRESIVQTLLNTPDPRGTGTFGTQQNTAPPDTFAELETFLTPRAGIYWYSVIGSTRTLYRFSVVSVSQTEPSAVPPGALWYNTEDDQLMALEDDLLTWTPVVGSPNGVITSAWEEINFDEILLNLLLEIEQRLYDAAPTRTTVDFDIDSVFTSDVSCSVADSTTETDTANTYFEEAFSSYLRDVGVADAFSASQYYVATDAFTWNYSLSTITTYPNADLPTANTQGWWTHVYQNLYGTPYPHLEPWVLQGYTNKPTWWDDEYLNDDPDTYGARRWKYVHGSGSPLPSGMWENIRVGIVPAGQLLPDGTTSTGVPGEATTWNYFSVNISDATVDGFAPDALFPPFWDYVANGGSSVVRSVFSDFANEITLPSADYTFATGGPIVFNWEVSSQRLYDDLTVGFRMQPVRFIHSAFGVNFIEVDGLQINEADCKVYSHRDALFHGDIVNTNEVFKVDGINQWYVNYNRFNGYDVAASDFRQLWQNWEPLLAYQFASIIDTQTLQLTNSNFDITERDYQLILKKSPGIADYSLDAFNVTVLESPSKLAQYDTQHLWKFQIDTFFPTTRTISYYEVHNYPVRADALTNTFHLYEYNIVGIDVSGIFYLDGDQTDAFILSNNFSVTNSTGNDGSYTASNVTFNPNTNRTAVTVGQSLHSTADGYIVANYRTHPWSTGDKIELTSTQNVPAPLAANREYFVIKIDDVTFQLASTLADANSGRNINLSSAGVGLLQAGQVFSKFTALNGATTKRLWNHYVIDTRYTRSLIPPQRVTGVQRLINLIDGYAVVTSNDGWVVNLENLEQDPTTGRPISWNLEIERFIDQIFKLPQQRATTLDTYPVSINSTEDTLTFNDTAPVWSTGTRISFSAGIGTLPAPLLTNQTYYAIRVNDTTIKVALTSSDAVLGNAVDIIGGGSATISVFETPTPRTRKPVVEINPFRNNVWLNTPQGILSNVIDGPTADIRNSQLITDQTGNQLTGKDISVYRWDKLSRIFIPSPIPNPSIALPDQTPYNTIHMASIQAFVDGFEHIVVFNDYAVDGTLIYDPFIGLNTARFGLQFFRQDEFTQRPVVGGYFLTAKDQLIRNIESSAIDLQRLYDTYRVLETTPIIREGRRTLGFRTTEQSFLDEIGLNPKSKFLFWKGMIQNKGSVRAIDVFTKSVKFEDATVDEFWAYKVADFGSNYELEFPALKLFIEDSRRSEKRFEFLRPDQVPSDATITFEGILLTDQTRWANQPDVLAQLEDNNSSFYFEAGITSVQVVTTATQGEGSPSGWYVETDVPFDDVMILKVSTAGSPGKPFLVETLVEDTDYQIINSRLIEFPVNPATLLGVTEQFRIYTINPARDTLNPSKVIDVKLDRVVAELPKWDPIRDHQYATANNLVDLPTASDPATYTNSPDSALNDDQFWNEPEVGLTWWDTSQRGYVPYNDSAIFDLDDRIQNWGKLADWSEIKLYQWTKSDIPPSEWDAVAEEQELDVSIDPKIRKSGRVRSETFQRERTALDIISINSSTAGSANTIVVHDADSILTVDDRIVLTTDGELPNPLTSGTFYFIKSITAAAGSPLQRSITLSLTEGGSVLELDFLGSPEDNGSGNHKVVPPFSDDDWVILKDIKKELIAARDKDNNDKFDLSVSGTAPNSIVAGDTVNIYKNGALLSEGVTVGTSGLTLIEGTNPADFITVIKPKHVLTDEEIEFDPDVSDDGTNLIQYKIDYNYSETSTATVLGVEVPEYFFWVENKTTRQNNNITMRQAAADLETIPTPYMILDNLQDELVGSPLCPTSDSVLADPSLWEDGDENTPPVAFDTNKQLFVIDGSLENDQNRLFYLDEPAPALTFFWEITTASSDGDLVFEYNSTSGQKSITLGTSLSSGSFTITDANTTNFWWRITDNSDNTAPIDDGVVEIGAAPLPDCEDPVLSPLRYTHLILRGLAGVVDDEDRYVLRFTRNFTLRDELQTRRNPNDLTASFTRIGAEPLDLKSHHTEWALIREKQPVNIPRALWNKVTEAIIGRLLSDAGSRVPSIAREVYDLTFHTDTQYGLGEDQAFVNGQLALATLIDDLEDPNNEFGPIDINVFFADHDFETEEGLIEVMDDIYNTFSFEAVNRIWFKILLDALTTKQKYPDLFKTSWVALSGTQVFQTEQLFTG